MPSSTVTIDLLYKCFALTCLHPGFVTLWPLSMYLTTRLRTNDTIFQYVLAYTSFIWLVFGLFRLDAWHRQRQSGSPRQTVNWNDELVVVTGGASGLGLSIASILATRRTTVAILDVVPPPNSILELGGSSIRYFECDVSSEEALAAVHTILSREFGREPSIVISNAAVMKPGSILSSSMSSIDTTLNVNLRSQFLLARQFLPRMLKTNRGHWITVASSLGYIGVHSLAAYSASKAGTISFHESLTAELSHSGITTTLVCPGQLDSPMFSQLRTPNDFLAPVLDSLDLAKAIVSFAEHGVAGEFGEPLYARFLPLLRAMPSGLQVLLRSMAGLDDAALALAKLI